jgi:hypothetical protein
MNSTPTSLQRICIVVALFILSSFTAFAQKAKEHYILHNPDPKISAEVYKAAIENKDLDQFRYLNQRRTIRFANSQASIEIFSAKELLDKYGKQISPLTIKDPAGAASIEFVLYPENKAIKEQIVK